ncbi:FabD lysophospholipase-like protein [Rhizoctonia solani]|uniref:FabD lysophospholipase-like protein n=1 Tax=Rhizoctonia solani TaxID=456999 RepID=A0A8H7H6X6_9AGAM|nr:FabD lysophospholipase-like protein [Rhizoctonia solani]
MMHRINSKRRRGEGIIEPYDHFDFIAGTGTGGACMLGRLRMPIEKVIEEYPKLMEKIFSEKKMAGSTMYKATTLQEALKAMVQDATGEEGAAIQVNDGCKNAIFAMAKHNMNSALPVIFRSYATSSNPSPNCAIWQALYATMAYPDLFKSIDIGDSSAPQSFVGGDLGCSNPLMHVLSEVSRVYPARKVACIISLGAGHARTIQVPNLNWRYLIFGSQDVIAMREMARDSERVAEEMALRFQSADGIYFRFNVDQGMQDMKDGNWERLGEVIQHTNVYLQNNETHQKMERAVDTSRKKRGNITTRQAG